nr:D-alanyl-D-alanine carboxypeptidase family protein [uncultured Mediterraneibacter sp.]
MSDLWIIRKTGAAVFAAVLSISLFITSCFAVKAAENSQISPSQLYARCAVLMDAATGRILFAKNGNEEAPMASTTKIMTCILALENGNRTDKVTASENAQSQPEVKLGMQAGDEFCLNDLLYSLMLESHNDSAVAIAEHISGSVSAFALLMNEKANDLGCTSTYFITPNGLDAKDDTGIHHTTAADLALIMRYCIMESPEKDTFLEITRADSHSFSDCSGTKAYSCTNHNAFLKMMEGALTGKTGFTADAGYCYVGALTSEGRTFIVALLACGWPNNKGYKWADTRKLMTYGIENYTYQTIIPEEPDLEIIIENGYVNGYPSDKGVKIPVLTRGDSTQVLMSRNDKVERTAELKEDLAAPVQKGEVLGSLIYTVNGSRAVTYALVSGESVKKRTCKICLDYIRDMFFMQR